MASTEGVAADGLDDEVPSSDVDGSVPEKRRSIVFFQSANARGAMEAIYFGSAHWHGNTGAGATGPWVGADLEQGMYYGGGNFSKNSTQNQPLPHEFVTLYLRGRTDGFVLKGGDATTGTLTTMYDGPRPTHGPHCSWSRPDYQPMQKQGAIILATGGDQSNSAMGKFYEGIMVLGNTTDATDDAVQANIVAVGYANIN